MSEIHDPDFRLNKYLMNISTDEHETEHKFVIYKMDETKKGFVGYTTSKVVDMALEEIFLRMVLPSDGMGPQYVGKIDPRNRFPDLTSPS